MTYLPFFQLILLCLVLLDQVIKDLLQSLGVCLEGGNDILDGPLHQHTVDHAKAFATARKGFQRVKDKPVQIER